MVSSSQARVLAILDRGDHPLDASEILQEIGGSGFHGPVYVALKALQQKGLIEKSPGAGQRGHMVNRFSLTDAGHVELEAFRALLAPPAAASPGEPG